MKRFLCLLLCLLTTSAAAETVQDQALAFIQAAGIGADSVMRVGDDVIVTLAGGGTATLHIPGDFDKYDLNWRFDGAADGDVALYLDHALSLLAALEAKIPADRENLSAAETIRVRSYTAMVDNGLQKLTQTGQQGLNVLKAQLSCAEESPLNGLRARLAEMLAQMMQMPEETPAVSR